MWIQVECTGILTINESKVLEKALFNILASELVKLKCKVADTCLSSLAQPFANPTRPECNLDQDISANKSPIGLR